jgi:DNA-binding transcriptional ArsR family regulator
VRDADRLDDVLDMVAGYFAVLSEPMRLRIVRAICSEEKSVTEIVDELDATQTNVSRHLNLMYRGRLVTRRKDGNRVFYSIADPQLVEICRIVCTQLAATMTDAQPAEKKLLKLMPAAKRRAA